MAKRRKTWLKNRLRQKAVFQAIHLEVFPCLWRTGPEIQKSLFPGQVVGCGDCIHLLQNIDVSLPKGLKRKGALEKASIQLWVLKTEAFTGGVDENPERWLGRGTIQFTAEFREGPRAAHNGREQQGDSAVGPREQLTVLKGQQSLV